MRTEKTSSVLSVLRATVAFLQFQVVQRHPSVRHAPGHEQQGTRGVPARKDKLSQANLRKATPARTRS